jgi:hypothetical protein
VQALSYIHSPLKVSENQAATVAATVAATFVAKVCG